jgi:hypothetical protein
MRALLLVVLAVVGQSASAQELTVRRSASGEYEAVLSVHVGGCGPFVTPVESVLVGPGQITIASGDFGPVICGVPPPGFDQTVVATLGGLSPGQYELVWTQPNFFSVAITFSVPSAPAMVPFASPLALCVLALLVFLVALRSNHVLQPTVGDMLRSSVPLPRSGRLTRR